MGMMDQLSGAMSAMGQGGFARHLRGVQTGEPPRPYLERLDEEIAATEERLRALKVAKQMLADNPEYDAVTHALREVGLY